MKGAADPSGLDAFTDPAVRLVAQRMGMWLFLATEAMIFAAIFLVVLVVRLMHPDGAAATASHLSPWIGAGNTLLLLSSSLLVAIAVAAAHHAPPLRRAAVAGFALAALFGLVFLAVKLGLEYRKEWSEGLFPGSPAPFPTATPGAELFFNLYLAATGLHAVHVLIGVCVLGGAAAGCAGGALKLPENAPEVEFCGLYWHLVDIVWVFLFPVLYLVQ